MKKTFILTGLALAAVAILTMSMSLAFASPRPPSRWGPSTCGPGGCNIAPAPPAIESKPLEKILDEWCDVPDSPNEAALYRNNVQIGCWNYAANCWRDYDARREIWGPKVATPPAEPPSRAQPVAKVTRLMPTAEEAQPESTDVGSDLTHPNNHGVDWSKIKDHEATYSGRKIGCERAHELVGKQVPDDAKRFRLTIIGNPAEQKEALTQFASLEPEIRDRMNTWAVAADHWSLKDGLSGQAVFKTQGTPVIYLQDPSGKVLHRQDDGKDMPTAIRKAVKAYDQTKDPDLRKVEPKKPNDPAAPTHPAVPVCCLAAGAALLLYLKGKP
jgi:hypothetical protein